MSYPGPPGVSKPSHPSLPPRPPVTRVPGFKPAFSPAPAAPSTATVPAPGYTAPTPSYPGYAPAAALPSYGAPPSVSPYVGSPAVPPVGAGRGAYGQPGPYNYPPPTYAQQPSYYGAAPTASYAAQPLIRNPFPASDSAGTDRDPETAAQIAQWQSAYMPKDPNDPSNKATSATSRSGTGTPAAAAQPVAAEAAAANAASGETHEKKKTVYREGGGKKWQDDSLLEWDPAHLRLFVGNLAGETTDDSLLKAFSRWRSVQKAKVVRDKRTTKSKGFGFVSFSDPEDFFQAAKEMNGKYIQSHPVVVRKAKTEVKPQMAKEDRKGKNNKRAGGGGGKSGSGMGAGADGAAAYEPHLGPAAGGGITKPGQKTKGGLKLLG